MSILMCVSAEVAAMAIQSRGNWSKDLLDDYNDNGCAVGCGLCVRNMSVLHNIEGIVHLIEKLLLVLDDSYSAPVAP